MRNANNIVVMKAGQISEQGTHAQLMSKRGIYYSLVKRQAGDGTLGTGDDPDKSLQKVQERLVLKFLQISVSTEIRLVSQSIDCTLRGCCLAIEGIHRQLLAWQIRAVAGKKKAREGDVP